MKHVMASKAFSVIRPRAILNNGSYTTVEIDTQGFRQMSLYVQLGATDIAATALKLQESDSAGSGQTDITGLVFGASGATALPVDTDDNGIFAFHVDLKGRKRYLTLVMTWGNGSTGGFASALALLSRPETVPSSATTRGLTGELLLPAA
jgi:hypothetical protein